ncbi:MAG: hemerythrin domain-containing protein [Bacteroidota bacterium]|jgi:hypothetical protein
MSISREISDYLSHDHDRLDRLLEQSLLPDGSIDLESYYQFRQGLLRHIGIEEKILIPALLSGRHEEITQTIDRIKLDHSAIVALLVPTPSSAIIAALRAILSGHNALEEQNGGMYERADIYNQQSLAMISQKMKEAPEVRSLPNNQDPKILEATRRALERAGYDPKVFSI